ncbi:MAG: SWIM zinc finger family protein [Pseudomonadota bacterium]
MATKAHWTDAYRAYDDDTLSALANPGLLRRALKDVEAGKLCWGEQGVAGGVVLADGQHVALDARGPQQALCDCPAPGICKHILGAALWLRGGQGSGGHGVARSGAVEAPDNAGTRAPDPSSNEVDGNAPSSSLAASKETPLPAAVLDPLAEVLALPQAALLKAAGTAAQRRAAATPVQQVDWQVQGAALVMSLPELGQVCRWVAGAGFGGMVSEVPAAQRKAVHLMALTAVRQAHGLAPDWPAAVRPDLPPPAEADAGMSERERAFLGQVDAMLFELLAGGLSHVSELTSARLLALNMSARGEGLPHLASLLRHLGGTVDLLVRRDHRAQERDALAAMARIHALCAALAQANGALATALRGRLRRDFDAQEALELLPVGGHWWQTRGGARGLTLAFWDAPGQRLLQAALARLDGSDIAFSRTSAWHSQAWWPGAGTAQRLCEGALRLDKPRLAGDGRLALGGLTRAGVLPAWRVDDARLLSLGCGDWRELAVRLRTAAGLAGERLDAVLLRPAATHEPVLDEACQQLVWRLQDGAGRILALAIRIGPGHEKRVDNLVRLMIRRAPVHAVLARVERGDAATSLVPLSVLSEDAHGVLRPIVLDFADELQQPAPLANRILRLFEARKHQAKVGGAPVALSMVQRQLVPVAEVLETQAATGRMALTPSQAERLKAALAQLEGAGLATLAHALRDHVDAPRPGSALRLAWLCELAIEIDGLPSADGSTMPAHS